MERPSGLQKAFRLAGDTGIQTSYVHCGIVTGDPR